MKYFFAKEKIKAKIPLQELKNSIEIRMINSQQDPFPMPERIDKICKTTLLVEGKQLK